MKRMPIEEITPGMKLARSLYYQYGGVMLNAGVTLDFRSISKLKQFGFTSLYVYDEDTEDILAYDYIDEKERLKITNKLRNLFNDVKEELAQVFEPEELKVTSTKEIKSKLESDGFQNILNRANIEKTYMTTVEYILDHKNFWLIYMTTQ